MKQFISILSLSLMLMLAGCGGTDIVETPMELELTSFSFKASLNPVLKSDAVGQINGDKIFVSLEGLEKVPDLIPTFDGVYDKIFCSGSTLLSGKTRIALSGEHIFLKLYDGKGQTREYEVLTYSSGYLPKVSVSTDEPVSSDKTVYVKGSVQISNCPEEHLLEAAMKFKGRGNATWSYAKKPYKMKLTESAEVLGFKSEKDWVLLAEYCDKSLLRTTYMNEFAKAVEMNWVPNSRHVDLYINGAYNGVYLLTEQIEDGKNRVAVKEDGFLFEIDNYYDQELLHFKSSRFGYPFTFKYPDPEDGEIAEGDDSYRFITDFINGFENALMSSDYRDPSKGYRKYIDVASFAKWFLVMELIECNDPNLFFTLESRDSKLKMSPVWDAEWSLGLASPGPNGWQTYPEKPIYTFDREYWRPQRYFNYLFRDPYFVGEVWREWQALKPKLQSVKENVAKEADALKYSQVKNFERWPILGTIVAVELVKFDTWEEEVGYCRDWLEKRLEWFDGYIEDLRATVK